MLTKSPRNSIGQQRWLVTFEDPDPPVPDGEGGYLQTWTAVVPPTWFVRVRPATARDAERVTAGTVITHVSHVVYGRFHPGVSTRTRMIHKGQTYHVTSVINVEDRDSDMELIADLQG